MYPTCKPVRVQDVTAGPEKVDWYLDLLEDGLHQDKETPQPARISWAQVSFRPETPVDSHQGPKPETNINKFSIEPTSLFV